VKTATTGGDDDRCRADDRRRDDDVGRAEGVVPATLPWTPRPRLAFASKGLTLVTRSDRTARTFYHDTLYPPA